MKKLHLLFAALIASLAMVACVTDEPVGGENETPHERIVFTLNSSEPIVAAPDEDIFYDFTVSYSQGIASIATSLNGEIIAGSEKSYADAPTEVAYRFDYTVLGSQFGETLDFVFTATGADGYEQSVDYAVWVSANAVEFTVALPENLPASIYSDVTLNFEVGVECGNVLKSLEIFKGETLYDSKQDFTSEKSYKHPFTYTPAAEDIGQSVEFHFVATDIKGNTAEAYYTVSIVKADAVGKMLYSENFNTSMSISTTTAFDTTEGGISGGAATQFDKTNVVKYGTLTTIDPETGEEVAVQGALEGCEVYDGDLTALTYTSDGTDVCLSKYGPNNETKNLSGAYLWYRKAKGGWFRVDGIKLHGATSFKLTYSQSGGKMVAEYSLDGGTTWNTIIETAAAAEVHEQKFQISESAETISLRFKEGNGTAHSRIDNIKFVEVL